MEPGQAGNLRVLRTHLIHLRPKLGEDSDNPRYSFTPPHRPNFPPPLTLQDCDYMTVPSRLGPDPIQDWL